MGAGSQIVSRARMATSLMDIRLIPFYLSVGAYFALYRPYLQYPPETMDAAIVKAIPIWSLAFFIHTTKDSHQTIYARHFFVGLFFSSLGDMCLIWRETLFIPGMLFFAVAHVCYMLGLATDFNFKRTRCGVFFTLLSMCLYLFISSGISSIVMKVLVLVYQGLIFGVGWLAVEHFVYDRTNSACFGACGAALFMFSDCLIGLDKWKFRVPLAEVVIMATYYAGQMCLALSTVRN
ncbi:lysoplasmalogenase TMEM86A-like [Haliotis cracherodii]|uniref:lysoplasmalogenase TMEM86A-like n=1 Tax=Haliotis cracherodii TaxID=6455 RepID=UPI0039ECB4C6